MSAYKTLTESLKNPSDLSFESDGAVTAFRAFEPIAKFYAERVDNPLALEVMEETLETIKSCLQNRKNMLNLT